MTSRRKHGPARLSTYFQVHNNQIQQLLSEGFVLREELAVYGVPGQVIIEGPIICQGGIVVNVEKRLQHSVEGGIGVVQTIAYSYNVSLQGKGVIFRYDSPHPTHNKEHHVHRYDVLNDDTVGTREFIFDEGAIPTLREVVDEARDWYYEKLVAD